MLTCFSYKASCCFHRLCFSASKEIFNKRVTRSAERWTLIAQSEKAIIELTKLIQCARLHGIASKWTWNSKKKSSFHSCLQSSEMRFDFFWEAKARFSVLDGSEWFIFIQPINAYFLKLVTAMAFKWWWKVNNVQIG